MSATSVVPYQLVCCTIAALSTTASIFQDQLAGGHRSNPGGLQAIADMVVLIVEEKPMSPQGKVH